jgi:hypothetical protein
MGDVGFRLFSAAYFPDPVGFVTMGVLVWFRLRSQIFLGILSKQKGNQGARQRVLSRFPQFYVLQSIHECQFNVCAGIDFFG